MFFVSTDHIRRFAFATVFLLACGGGKSERPATTTENRTEAPPDRAEGIDICVRLHEKAAECPGEFMDAVLALRAKYQPEFAAALADPQQGPAIREMGMKETVADGTGPIEQRRAKCEQFVDHGPPATLESRSITKCFDIAACKERVDCMMPSLEDRMSRGGYKPPAE